MTTEHDARTRTVVDWLREDAHENAERALIAALNDVDHTQQRRAWSPASKFPVTNGVGKLVTAAAVASAMLLAFAILPLAVGPGGPPPPTASPTPTVEPSEAAPLSPIDGPLMARTYRMPTSPSILLTFPAGWAARGEGESWDIRKNRDQPDELVFEVWGPDIRVYPDACANNVQPPPTGPTAADLIAALDAQAHADVSDPVDVMVGGRPGQRLDISIPDDLDIAQCYEGTARIWTGDSYLAFGPEPIGIVAPIHVVETASGRIVFGWRDNPAASAADRAELDAIVASMVIED
jgi:hypothetical protein